MELFLELIKTLKNLKAFMSKKCVKLCCWFR